MLYILPETAGDIFVVQATHELTTEDFNQSLKTKLDEKIDQLGRVRVVIYLDNGFSGFEADSLWDTLSFEQKYLDAFSRVAIVGDEKWTFWPTQLQAKLSQGEAKRFGALEFLNAIHWIDSAEN